MTAVRLEEAAAANMQALARNSYPGRGIVIGLTPDGQRWVQVYWIMGRSENSRNRIFVAEGGTVRTQAWDESRVEDPSLIIYNCIRIAGGAHVVTNGDQTDTICEALEAGGSFEGALATRTFEPDAPNYTPRIAGIVDLADRDTACRLAILKTVGNVSDCPARHYFTYESGIGGLGHCITTYAGDGSPLPSFDGEPYLLPIENDVAATAALYWRTLDEDNRISLLVKAIEPESGKTELSIINKHEG
jgi:IMP cyclohydrolase